MTDRSMRVAVILIAMLGVTAGEMDAQDIPGCYAFRSYQWSKHVDSVQTPLHTPPDTFRLYSLPGPGEPRRGHQFESGRSLVRPRMPKPSWLGSFTPEAFWSMLPSDSVRIVWTNGFTGASVTAQRDGDGFRGRLEWLSDAIGMEPWPHAEVVLDRVSCPPWMPDNPTVGKEGGTRRSNEDLAGCYAFRPYQWSRTVDPIAARRHTPPDTFRLYFERGPEPPEHDNMNEAGRLLVRPRLDVLRGNASGSGAFWLDWNADSVRIVWTNGVEGAWVVARPHGKGLAGRLQWFQDALGPEPFPSAKVTMDRVVCPAWLPETPESSASRPTVPYPAWPRTGTELHVTHELRLRRAKRGSGEHRLEHAGVRGQD